MKRQTGRTRLEQHTKSPKKTQNGKRGAVKSAAISTDLAKIIAAWPTLPQPIRRAMLALIGAAK